MTKLKLELGAKKTWRSYSPGRWVIDKEKQSKEVGLTGAKHLKFEPGTYIIDVDESTADGLITASEEWQSAFRSHKDPEGHINRMVRVTVIGKRNETPDPPAGVPVQHRLMKTLAMELAAALKPVTSSKN